MILSPPFKLSVKKKKTRKGFLNVFFFFGSERTSIHAQRKGWIRGGGEGRGEGYEGLLCRAKGMNTSKMFVKVGRRRACAFAVR